MFSKTRSLITGKLWKPKNPYCVEYLKYLHSQLLKNQVVDDSNVDMIIEVLRSTAELLIWGDQNDSAMFDFFFEKQMLAFFIRYMKQRHVARQFHVQLLQTLSILLENIRSQTTAYYLMSNNYLNAVITYRFDFSDEECMAYFITLLKTLSLKLDRNTVNFFFNEKTLSFPLYTESLRFLDHSESMVRIAVRNITLNVFRIDNRAMQTFVRERTGSRFFGALTACMIRYVRDADIAYRTLHSLQLASDEQAEAMRSKSEATTPVASAPVDMMRRSASPPSSSDASGTLTQPGDSQVPVKSSSPTHGAHRSNTSEQLNSLPLNSANRSSSLNSLAPSNSLTPISNSTTTRNEARRRSPRPTSVVQQPSVISSPDLSNLQRSNGATQSLLTRMTQLRGRLTDLLQEHADQLHFVNDVFTMHNTGLNTLLVRALCDRLVNAVYLNALVRYADPHGTNQSRVTPTNTSVCNSTSSATSSNVAGTGSAAQNSSSGRHSAATSPTESRKDIDDAAHSEQRTRTSSSVDSRRGSAAGNSRNGVSSANEARGRFAPASSNASAASVENEDDTLLAIARSVNEHALRVDPQLATFLIAHALGTIEHEEVADPLIEALFCSLSTVRALVQRSPSRRPSTSASSTTSETDVGATADPQPENDAESNTGTDTGSAANAAAADTNVTDEEKLLKLRRTRFEHSSSCTSHCCLLQYLIVESCDLEQRRGDQATLFLLCVLFALLSSSQLRGKFLTLLNLHSVSLNTSRSESTSDADGRSTSAFMMSLRVWLFDKLLTLIHQACVAEPRVRPITFNLAVSVTRLLVPDTEGASDKNAIRTAFESFYAMLCASLRGVAKNDELFLDVFEYEYEQFRLQMTRQLGANGNLTQAAFEQAYLNDTEVLLPCMSTPVCGLASHKRLPSGIDEQRRHSLHVLFRLRRELLSLAQLTETDLPLLHSEIDQRQFRISDKLDLDKRDLVAVDVTENGQQNAKSYFLTFDKVVFLLVEPDAQRIGWGVVRFVGRLQDTEIAAQKHDSRCLDVIVQRPFSASAQQQKLFSFRSSSVQPLLAATFRFEDYIRCLAAKQRFSKARQKIRLAKSRLIVKLLDARLISGDSSATKRKRTAATATAATSTSRPARAYTPQQSECDPNVDSQASGNDAPCAFELTQSADKTALDNEVELNGVAKDAEEEGKTMLTVATTSGEYDSSCDEQHTQEVLHNSDRIASDIEPEASQTE